MLKKLDNLLFKGIHLALLGFFLYGGEKYTPNSPAMPILWFITAVVVFWGIADIYFIINNYSVKKQIKKYYY